MPKTAIHVKVLPLNPIDTWPINWSKYCKIAMKTAIHPQYNTDVKVTCACGNTFVTGSTIEDSIQVEVCAQCHPFYTGKQKLVDTAKRVDKFEARVEKSKVLSKSRKGKKVKRVEAQAKKYQDELAEKTAAAATSKKASAKKKEVVETVEPAAKEEKPEDAK